jgi:formylglycine-generating enzyme required for sulfatase activity
MRRWFLSYHSPDQALAERLKATLERKDTDARVFFAPSSLRAGGFWSRTLAEEIAQADAFILLVGEKGVGVWQELEYDEALDRRVKSPNLAVVLVLLKGQTAPGFSFLRRMHWIVTADPASEKSVTQLIDAAVGNRAPSGELWRHAAPYRGLAAMEEKDSDYFFGRGRETVDVVSVLAAAADRLPVLLGNSGVGKSSLAQAGVLAALKRQGWREGMDEAPAWPQAFNESRRWCFLTLKPGTEPLKSLVEAFLDTWQFDAGDPARIKRRNEWIDMLLDVNGKTTLPDLLDETERRYKALDRIKPPAFLFYVDQGEELYVRAEEHQRRRFSEVIAQGVADPRLYMLMSMRSDFLGELQKDEPLFKVHRKVDVPPLREAELREVVSRPAELLSARFETAGLVDIITRRTAEDSVKDVGALPLLSYTLDDMWTHMVKRCDGVLRLPAQSFEPGGVLVDRADNFLAIHPKSQDELRRIFTLKLATVREGEEPTRRRALRSEFSEEEWRLVCELADHPNRLLVTATPEGGETYAEVAHEAIFRRWDKLREWVAAEREFLAWRAGLEAASRAWRVTDVKSRNEALLMGLALTQAESWIAKRPDDIPAADRQFIMLSSRASQQKKLRIQALVWGVAIGEAIAIFAGVFIWVNQWYVKEQWDWFWTMRPYRIVNFDSYVLRSEAERALRPGDAFQECAKNCPEMIVVPAGEFMMGAPVDEQFRHPGELPQHRVTITKQFAVSRFLVTFADWDACVSVGGCPQVGSDSGWGRGMRPVINVSWDDAQAYVAWLSIMTGKAYRLLSEAEWEYAARAKSQTAYSFGADPAMLGQYAWYNANSDYQTHPVGGKRQNAFSLYDMAGNVWEWVQDCYHGDYIGAPLDGSAWVVGEDCHRRIVRGGSWYSDPQDLRSASRRWFSNGTRFDQVGFRVGRTLTP